MLKMVDGTGIIGVDMVCPLGGAVSPPQPPNYDRVEMEGAGRLMLPNSLKAPLERLELLGNSVQSENPSPDNPQEIKSAGRKSKNLFNKNTAKQGYEFPSAGSAVEALKEGWFVSDFMPVKATTYYISGKSTGNGYKLYNKDKVFVKNTQASFGNIKFDEGIAYFRINGEIKDLDKIQVEEGIVATDYEPYGYLLDVKVTGKNLLSNKPTDWMIGKATSWGAVPQTPVSYGPNVKNAIATINVKSSTNYSFINKETNKLWVRRIIELDANGLGLVNHALYVNESLNYKKYNFSTRSNTANIVFEIKKVDNTELLSTDIESNKIMLVEGEVNEPTPYEPYTEQSVQIALDEPLRGIKRPFNGEFIQETLSQSGIIRRFKEVEITKNARIITDLGDYGASEINSILARYPDASLKKGGVILCGELKNINNWAKEEESVSMTEQGIDFRLSRERLGLGSDTTPEENKVAVIKYLENHPLHCIAELNEPITEPLLESIQQQLQALHSENGTTHVFVDSGEVPCGIKLTYRKEI